MRRSLLIVAIVVAVVVGCDARAPAVERPPPHNAATSVAMTTGASASVGASSSASVATSPPCLDGGPLIALAVPGFGDAVVSLPVGATGKRPLLLAVHGNYDRPEWQCAVWRGIVGDRGFVLCPRGVARDDSPSNDDIRFTFGGSDAVARELDADRDALRDKYAYFLDESAIVYTGFSLGAITGVPYLLRDPSNTPRAVLTEGSHDRWTFAAAKSFAKKGGERVLFACGQPSCVSMAKSAAKVLSGSKIETKVVLGAGVGHGYDGKVAEAIAEEFDWLVEGDARWE